MLASLHTALAVSYPFSETSDLSCFEIVNDNVQVPHFSHAAAVYAATPHFQLSSLYNSVSMPAPTSTRFFAYVFGPGVNPSISFACYGSLRDGAPLFGKQPATLDTPVQQFYANIFGTEEQYLHSLPRIIYAVTLSIFLGVLLASSLFAIRVLWKSRIRPRSESAVHRPVQETILFPRSPEETLHAVLSQIPQDSRSPATPANILEGADISPHFTLNHSAYVPTLEGVRSSPSVLVHSESLGDISPTEKSDSLFDTVLQTFSGDSILDDNTSSNVLSSIKEETKQSPDPFVDSGTPADAHPKASYSLATLPLSDATFLSERALDTFAMGSQNALSSSLPLLQGTQQTPSSSCATLNRMSNERKDISDHWAPTLPDTSQAELSPRKSTLTILDGHARAHDMLSRNCEDFASSTPASWRPDFNGSIGTSGGSFAKVIQADRGTSTGQQRNQLGRGPSLFSLNKPGPSRIRQSSFEKLHDTLPINDLEANHSASPSCKTRSTSSDCSSSVADVSQFFVDAIEDPSFKPRFRPEEQRTGPLESEWVQERRMARMDKDVSSPWRRSGTTWRGPDLSLGGLLVEDARSDVVAASQRTDGSWRREISIRPGFHAKEDYEKYVPPQRRAQFDLESASSALPPSHFPLNPSSTTLPSADDQKEESVASTSAVPGPAVPPGLSPLPPSPEVKELMTLSAIAISDPPVLVPRPISPEVKEPVVLSAVSVSDPPVLVPRPLSLEVKEPVVLSAVAASDPSVLEPEPTALYHTTAPPGSPRLAHAEANESFPSLQSAAESEHHKSGSYCVPDLLYSTVAKTAPPGKHVVKATSFPNLHPRAGSRISKASTKSQTFRPDRNHGRVTAPPKPMTGRFPPSAHGRAASSGAAPLARMSANVKATLSRHSDSWQEFKTKVRNAKARRETGAEAKGEDDGTSPWSLLPPKKKTSAASLNIFSTDQKNESGRET